MIQIAIAKSLQTADERSIPNPEIGMMVEVKVPWDDERSGRWHLAFIKGIVDDEVGQVFNVGVDNQVQENKKNCFVPNICTHCRPYKVDVNVYSDSSFPDLPDEFEYDDMSSLSWSLVRQPSGKKGPVNGNSQPSSISESLTYHSEIRLVESSQRLEPKKYRKSQSLRSSSSKKDKDCVIM